MKTESSDRSYREQVMSIIEGMLNSNNIQNKIFAVDILSFMVEEFSSQYKYHFKLQVFYHYECHKTFDVKIKINKK